MVENAEVLTKQRQAQCFAIILLVTSSSIYVHNQYSSKRLHTDEGRGQFHCTGQHKSFMAIGNNTGFFHWHGIQHFLANCLDFCLQEDVWKASAPSAFDPGATPDRDINPP